MQGQIFNQNMPHNPPNKPTLKDNLNTFIQVSQNNQMKINQRLDCLEALMK